MLERLPIAVVAALLTMVCAVLFTAAPWVVLSLGGLVFVFGICMTPLTNS
jgi:hypothetical protein